MRIIAKLKTLCVGIFALFSRRGGGGGRRTSEEEADRRGNYGYESYLVSVTNLKNEEMKERSFARSLPQLANLLTPLVLALTLFPCTHFGTK